VDYAQFKQCPLGKPATKLCLFTQTEGGEFVAGSKTVPISRTITLQGGCISWKARKRNRQDEFIAAKDGETVSKAPQPVPGGLEGVVDPKRLAPALRVLYKEFIDRASQR